MELGAPDKSGRRRPVPVAGSDFVLPLQVAVVAIGNQGNPLVQSATPDLNTNPMGYIEADPDTLKTSKRAVFAGGDIVTGRRHGDPGHGRRTPCGPGDPRLPDDRCVVMIGTQDASTPGHGLDKLDVVSRVVRCRGRSGAGCRGAGTGATDPDSPRRRWPLPGGSGGGVGQRRRAPTR